VIFKDAIHLENFPTFHYLALSCDIFIYAQNQLIALLGFGAVAWHTAPRDQFIGWSHDQRKKNLHLIINNARFLFCRGFNPKTWHQ